MGASELIPEPEQPDQDAPDTGGWDRDRHCATDLRGVDWAGRKLRAAQEQVEMHRACFAAEQALLVDRIRQAQERLERSLKPLLNTIDFMENVIRTFASTPDGRAEVLKGLPSKRKSCLLPSGVTVAYRTPREQIEVTDAQALMDWADVSGFSDAIFPEPAPLTVEELVSKKGLNKVLSTVKSEVPGVKRTPGVEEVQVWTDLSKEEGK